MVKRRPTVPFAATAKAGNPAATLGLKTIEKFSPRSLEENNFNRGCETPLSV
jgi:hypothetical protein